MHRLNLSWKEANVTFFFSYNFFFLMQFPFSNCIFYLQVGECSLCSTVLHLEDSLFESHHWTMDTADQKYQPHTTPGIYLLFLFFFLLLLCIFWSYTSLGALWKNGWEWIFTMSAHTDLVFTYGFERAQVSLPNIFVLEPRDLHPFRFIWFIYLF